MSTIEEEAKSPVLVDGYVTNLVLDEENYFESKHAFRKKLISWIDKHKVFVRWCIRIVVVTTILIALVFGGKAAFFSALIMVAALGIDGRLTSEDSTSSKSDECPHEQETASLTDDGAGCDGVASDATSVSGIDCGFGSGSGFGIDCGFF